MASRDGEGFRVLRSELQAREAKIAALKERSSAQDAILRGMAEEHARIEAQFKALQAQPDQCVASRWEHHTDRVGKQADGTNSSLPREAHAGRHGARRGRRSNVDLIDLVSDVADLSPARQAPSLRSKVSQKGAVATHPAA